MGRDSLKDYVFVDNLGNVIIRESLTKKDAQWVFRMGGDHMSWWGTKEEYYAKS